MTFLQLFDVVQFAKKFRLQSFKAFYYFSVKILRFQCKKKRSYFNLIYTSEERGNKHEKTEITNTSARPVCITLWYGTLRLF